MGYSTGELAHHLRRRGRAVGARRVAARLAVSHRHECVVRRPVGPPTAAFLAPPTLPATLTAPAPLSASDNRRVGWRLAALLVALSALISLTSAVLQLGAGVRESGHDRANANDGLRLSLAGDPRAGADVVGRGCV